jgi:AcrR family transcriptional regulator
VARAGAGRSRRSRPGRGLSLERIVTATLELMDEQGIGAASMRAVASRLGVRSMSLYRYVQDRDDLFDAVVERIVNELADDPEVQLRPTDGWRPYLTGTRGAPLRPGPSACFPAGRHPAAYGSVGEPAAQVAALGRGDADRIGRRGVQR